MILIIRSMHFLHNCLILWFVGGTKTEAQKLHITRIWDILRLLVVLRQRQQQHCKQKQKTQTVPPYTQGNNGDSHLPTWDLPYLFGAHQNSSVHPWLGALTWTYQSEERLASSVRSLKNHWTKPVGCFPNTLPSIKPGQDKKIKR